MLSTDHADDEPQAATAVAPAPGRRVRMYDRLPALKTLGKQHILLSDYMVSGCPSAALAAKVGRVANEPMPLADAARLLRLRMRYARWVASQPIWHAHHAKQLQAFREGHKAEALRRVVDTMRNEGAGKAADRKVQLTASAMILGDSIAQQGQTNVNVNVGVAVQTPGYVLDLRPDDSQPVTIEASIEERG